MIVFPNGKINLGLNVLRKRNDGFHDLETVFYPVPLCDIAEVIISENHYRDNDSREVTHKELYPLKAVQMKSGVRIMFSGSGLTVDAGVEQNLCIKACDLFDARFGLADNLMIHLHKIIPMGAGLGGGSSDAAFILSVLNELSGCKAAPGDLTEMAALLGSDCAFFLLNKPAFAKGRGESLTPLNISLKGYHLVIIKPPVHIATREAFAGIRPRIPERNIAEIITLPVDQWSGKLINDFEEVLFSKYPEIASIKKALAGYGAVYTSLTGSGSAVYGLFRERVPGKEVFGANYYYSTILR